MSKPVEIFESNFGEDSSIPPMQIMGAEWPRVAMSAGIFNFVFYRQHRGTAATSD